MHKNLYDDFRIEFESQEIKFEFTKLNCKELTGLDEWKIMEKHHSAVC